MRSCFLTIHLLNVGCFVMEFSGMSASSSSSSSGTVLAAEPNGSAETVASGGDVDEDDSAILQDAALMRSLKDGRMCVRC